MEGRRDFFFGSWEGECRGGFSLARGVWRVWMCVLLQLLGVWRSTSW